MNIEKWIIAHFSPTGGTKKVAGVMAKADDAVPVQVPGNTPYKELKPSACKRKLRQVWCLR